MYSDEINFVIGTGTVFGQLYHTVEPIINWIEIHKWCVELFGTEDSIWDNY